MEMKDRLTALEGEGITAAMKLVQLERDMAALEATVQLLLQALALGLPIERPDGMILRFRGPSASPEVMS